MEIICRECYNEIDISSGYPEHELMNHSYFFHENLMIRCTKCMQRIYSSYHFLDKFKDKCTNIITSVHSYIDYTNISDSNDNNDNNEDDKDGVLNKVLNELKDNLKEGLKEYIRTNLKQEVINELKLEIKNEIKKKLKMLILRIHLKNLNQLGLVVFACI